jgi:hypothetical protein
VARQLPGFTAFSILRGDFRISAHSLGIPQRLQQARHLFDHFLAEHYTFVFSYEGQAVVMSCETAAKRIS